MKHKTLDRRHGMKVATILSSNSVDHKSILSISTINQETILLTKALIIKPG